MRSIAVVVATAVLGSPRSRTALVAGTVIVPRTVFTALLPGSNIACRWATLPWLGITVIRLVAALVGTGFNATRRVFTRSTSRKFVHELLFGMLDKLI
jgi:hypothetical protein